MVGQKPLTKEGLDKFRLEYLEGIDYSYWEDRLYLASSRLNKLKKAKNKSIYLIDAYSIYMQVAEIVLITMHSLSVPPHAYLKSLAIDNNGIRQFASKIQNHNDYLKSFVQNFVYKIRQHKPTTEEISFDVNLLKECIHDYLSNYQFLNSFKHGFRVQSSHGDNSLSIGLSADKMFKLLEGDSQIKYYYFNYNKGKPASFNEETITFNNERIFGKALFLIAFLQNIKISSLAMLGKKGYQKYPIFYIKDRDDWNRNFGSFHFSRELFVFISDSDKGLN